MKQLDDIVSACEDCIMPQAASGGSTAVAMCVTCPFCQQTVNAILTPEAIECPKCNAKVKR